MDAVWSDWRFAARRLRRTPGFTIVAVLTLALGIGATSAIFSVVYGVLLRPFPFRSPQSLVIIAAESSFGGRTRASNYSAMELEPWQARSQLFESLAMWGEASFSLRSDAGTVPVEAAIVSPEFFSTLGEPMTLGRPIAVDDGRAAAVVISDRLWRREFAADPRIVGRSVILSEHAYVVIGVARPDFQFPSMVVDAWTPLGYAQQLNEDSWVTNWRGGGFHFIARLRPGVRLAVAREHVTQVAASVTRDFPALRAASRRSLVVGLNDWFTNAARPAILMLFAAVTLVHVVACANAMNLVLARQASHQKEMAVRRALGASAGRLVSYAIAESSLIALGGGISGLLLAAFGVRAFVALWSSSLPRADAIHVDLPVVIFALALTLLSVGACGLGPAARWLARHPGTTLRPAASIRPSGGRRVRSLLVLAQVAASVVLLVGASLLGRSLIQLLNSGIGVKTDRVVSAELDISLGRLRAPNQQSAIVDRVVERVAAIRGVRRVAVGTSLPMNGARLRYTLRDQAAPDGGTRDLDLEALATTPDFFSTVGIPLLDGRFFAGSDSAVSRPVMIMSAHTARLVFGDREAIGRTLDLPSPRPPGHEEVALVGIVGDVKVNALDAPADGGIYRPFAQQPWSFCYLIVQTSGDTAAVAGSLRQAVAQVDPHISFSAIRTLDETLSHAAAEPRFRTTLLVMLAALALALASIGLYGAVAYSVALRTTELGIRIALGASPRAVTTMVVGEGVTLALLGAAIGITGALAFSRVVQSLLYGVAPTDALSFVAAPSGLLLLAAIASYIPARRAATVDPIVALRAE